MSSPSTVATLSSPRCQCPGGAAAVPNCPLLPTYPPGIFGFDVDTAMMMIHNILVKCQLICWQAFQNEAASCSNACAKVLIGTFIKEKVLVGPISKYCENISCVVAVSSLKLKNPTKEPYYIRPRHHKHINRAISLPSPQHCAKYFLQ